MDVRCRNPCLALGPVRVVLVEGHQRMNPHRAMATLTVAEDPMDGVVLPYEIHIVLLLALVVARGHQCAYHQAGLVRAEDLLATRGAARVIVEGLAVVQCIQVAPAAVLIRHRVLGRVLIPFLTLRIRGIHAVGAEACHTVKGEEVRVEMTFVIAGQGLLGDQ